MKNSCVWELSRWCCYSFLFYSIKSRFQPSDYVLCYKAVPILRTAGEIICNYTLWARHFCVFIPLQTSISLSSCCGLFSSSSSSSFSVLDVRIYSRCIMAVYRFWLFLFFFFLHWRLWCWMLTDTTKGTCATPAATFSFCFDSFFSSCGWNVIRPLLVFFFSSFFSFLIIWWWRYPPPRLGHDEMSLSNSRAAPVKKKRTMKMKGPRQRRDFFRVVVVVAFIVSGVERPTDG